MAKTHDAHNRGQQRQGLKGTPKMLVLTCSFLFLFFSTAPALEMAAELEDTTIGMTEKAWTSGG